MAGCLHKIHTVFYNHLNLHNNKIFNEKRRKIFFFWNALICLIVVEMKKIDEFIYCLHHAEICN